MVIGGGAWLVSDRRGLTPLMICLAVIVGVLVVDVVTGARLQFNTMFGYSPTIGGRFAGIGNLAYAQLASAALLLAALIVAWKTPATESRASGRSGAVLAIAVLAIALVVDGLPIWGADIGGVLSMVPAYVIVTVGLLGLRVRARTLLIAVGATACALGAATLVDLSRPEDHRSHLGRLVSSTRDDGWRSLTVVVQRKLSANIDALWPSQWTIISAIVLAFVVALVWRAPGGLPALLERIPSLRPALVGLVVLAVLGYALNDSGIPIPGVMVGIVTPVLVVILLRAGDEDKTGRVPQKIGETG